MRMSGSAYGASSLPVAGLNRSGLAVVSPGGAAAPRARNLVTL